MKFHKEQKHYFDINVFIKGMCLLGTMNWKYLSTTKNTS